MTRRLRARAARALVVALLTSLAVPLAATPARAVAPADPPTLLSPAEGDTVGGDPVFAWSAVPGAVKYRIQVSKTDVFSEIVFTADTYNTHATPTAALPVGALYWRVAATDGTSTGVGPYGTGSFTRVWAGAPVPVTPEADATLVYPTDPLLFTWQPLAGALKYNVQVDDDVNFVGAATLTTNNTSYTLTDPQTSDQQLYWRVQGVSGTVLSPWSDARAFTVQWPATPVLTYPPVGHVITDVALRWSPVDGAATYQVQVSPNPDFSNNVTVDKVVQGTSYSHATGLPNGSYFWRVRARDAKSVPNLGGWSNLIEAAPGQLEPAQFTRSWGNRPTLLAPDDEDFVVTVPTLRWTAVPHASHYEIWLGYDSAFTPDTYETCYTNQTSYTPYRQHSGTTPVLPGSCAIVDGFPHVDRPLYWKVRGIDASATGITPILGQFSEPRSFMWRQTALATPVYPADGAVVSVPTMTWNPVQGVAKYTVHVYKGGAEVHSEDTYSTTYTPPALTPDTYRWYVIPVDDYGRTGPRPAEESWPGFTLVAPDTTVSGFELLGPADGAASPVWPSMSWRPVTGATQYKVFYGLDGSDIVYEIGVTKATAFTEIDVPPTPDTYRWFVRAYDADNVLLATSMNATFEVSNFTLVQPTGPANCTVQVVCVNTPETPRLEWTPTPYTGGYLVYLANDAAFTNVVRVYETQHPTLTPRESLLDSSAGQAYYWFVRPCRSASEVQGCGTYDESVFSSAWAFRKQSLGVQLVSPANGSTTDSPRFDWTEFSATNAAATPAASQGAKRYRVEVSTKADFSTKVDSQDVEQTTYTPWERTYPEGPLYWRVWAIDGSNNALTSSPIWLVTKSSGALAPLYPQPGATLSGTPYFRWEAQPHVKTYEVEAYRNGDTNFSSTNKETKASGQTRLTAFAPTASLATGSYAWRVRRLDTDGLPGPWASGGVFTLSGEAPSLLAPAEGEKFTKTTMLFSWSAATSAVKYKFESSTSAAFGTLIDNVTTVSTAWAPVVNYPEGRVYWRVKALDADGNVLAVSQHQSIVKDGTRPTVLSKTPTTGAAISGGAFTVTFKEPVVGVSASTFTMKVASSGSPVAGTVTPGVDASTTTATFKPSAMLLPGETYTLSLSDAITDVYGNALVPFSWSVRTALLVDGASPAVTQAWDRDSSTSASGGAYLASRTTGAKVGYTFTGTSASILGRRAADGGYADVYLDGVHQGTVSFYSSTTKYKQVVWSKTGLVDKSHKVELKVRGSKPSSSSSYWVYPDAFRYGATTLEETSTLVVQAHRTVALSGAYNGSYLLGTHTASGDTGSQPYVSLRFKGTGVSWKGIRGTSGGYAKVYVDGVAKATVDTFGSASASGQTLWSTTGLSNGVHTVKVVMVGTRRSGSGGYNVTVDAFTVT